MSSFYAWMMLVFALFFAAALVSLRPIGLELFMWWPVVCLILALRRPVAGIEPRAEG